MFVFTGSCNWVRKDEKDEPMNDEDAADDEHGQVKKQEEGPAWTFFPVISHHGFGKGPFFYYQMFPSL